MLHNFKKRRTAGSIFRLSESKGIALVCSLGMIGGIAASAQELVESATTGLVRTHPRLLRWGPFNVNPSISFGTLYDDNIVLNSQNQAADLIWSIVPVLSAVAGESGSPHITFDYRPTASFFTEHPALNAVDQLASLRATYPFARLTLDVTQNYVSASGGVVDVGNRVSRQIYTTLLNSKYELSPKTSFEINARQELSDYDRLISSREWGNSDWFNYELTPKITTSIGVTIGYLESKPNPPQTYEQLLVRAAYRAAEKLDVSVSAGEEIRQIRGTSEQPLSPVFSIMGEYTPAFGTKINLQARRQEQNSAAFVGEDYISTGFLASVTHRAWERYLLSLSAGYDNYDYRSISKTVNVNRSDNVYTLRGGVDVAFSNHFSVGINYTYRRDDSSSSFSFVNNQIAVVASVAY